MRLSQLVVRRGLLFGLVILSTLTRPAAAFAPGFGEPRRSSNERSRAAQRAPECAGENCAPAVRQIWLAAAEIHQLKLQFVAALRQFTESQAGTFGDEGVALRSGLESMAKALARWDDAILEFEAGVARVARSAEIHVALGTVYLDRHRVEDALREFGAAGRLDAARVDVYTLQALAYSLANRSAEAAAVLRKAAALAPNRPTIFYALSQQLIKLDRWEESKRALLSFQETLRASEASGEKLETGGAPFERADLLRQVAGVAPIFPLAQYAEGYRLLQKGEYATAIERLKQAIALDPLLTDGPMTARTRVAQGGSALRQGQLPSALSRLEEAVQEAPNHSEAHRLLGVAYWADQQYDRSLEHLRAAIHLSPDDERARRAMADVLLKTGRFIDAAQVLKEALPVIPGSGQAHYALGQVYQNLSFLPQAVREFEESATFDPLVGRDYLYQTIGGISVNQANFDGAVKAYAKRIDVNPNNAESHRKLGEIYFLQGRHDEALAEFSAALLIDPRDAEAYAASGQIYLRAGKFAEAVEPLRRALAVNAGHKEARYALATSLIRLGKTEEGKSELAVFQRMQAEVVASGQREFQLDAVRRDAARNLTSGDYNRALEQYRQALNDDPNTARSSRDLGLALMKAERPQEAIGYFERAQQLEPTAEGHRSLADAYKAMGNAEESERQNALYEQTIQRRKLERLRELGGSR